MSKSIEDRDSLHRSRAKLPQDAAARPKHSSMDPELEPNSIVTRDGAFIEPEDRLAMIAEAAYYRAEQRGFDPGHEVADWLTAEAQIDEALARGEAPTACSD